MAKYTVTYKCGHMAEVKLYGKMSARDNIISYCQTIECKDCQVARKVAEAQESGCHLTGSDKQIAWAFDIRHKFMAVKSLLDSGCKDPNNEQAKEVLSKLNEVAKQKEANWWINNKDYLDDAKTFLRHYKEL